jgi:hypothetical protein
MAPGSELFMPLFLHHAGEAERRGHAIGRNDGDGALNYSTIRSN